jgi:hypothetical protein
MSLSLEWLPDEQRAWLDRVAEGAHQDVETVLMVVISVFMTRNDLLSPLAPHLGADGLTNEERAEDAEYYRATVARNLTAEERAVLMAAEGLPQRELRQAG